MAGRNKILIFLNTYLPGYKSGGPVQAISNLVEALHDYFDFYIVTKDRDFQDINKYSNIKYKVWNKVGYAKVRYLQPRERNIFVYKNIINSFDFDLVYLQSFWNIRFSLFPLIALSCSKKKNMPVLLHPRGEFFENALKRKKIKKDIYIFFYKLFLSYNRVIFQVSTNIEKKSLLNSFEGKLLKVFIASDIPASFRNFEPILPNGNSLKLVFISRINSHKNLSLLLLQVCKLSINIDLDIFGVIDDISEWEKCKHIINNCPKNIKINYYGPVCHDKILINLKNYDMFCLLSKSENFGYSICEALSSGVPVIISDKTIWHDLVKYNAGWEIPLGQPDVFIDKVMEYYRKNRDERLNMRKGAIQYAADVSNKSKILTDNLTMFNTIILRGK